METIQMSFNWWMGEPVVHLQNGILFSNRKGWNADNATMYKYGKWKKLDTKDHVYIKCSG